MKGISKQNPFGLRIPPELKNWLSRSAASNHRSLNSEVVTRLEESKRNEEVSKEKTHG